MAAPKKNQFWKARAKSGRDKIFSSPDELLNAAYEYFEHVEANPLKEQKVFGSGMIMTEKKMRPFTLTGLYIFLNITRTTWKRYAKEEEYKNFWDTIERIEDIIFSQKFDGAAAGLLNPVIIARDLGLKDKTETEHSVTVKRITGMRIM